MIDITDVSLHDAYITGVDVRTLDDHFDYIAMYIETTELVDDFDTNKIKIVFEGCYKAQFGLQMWIKGKDTIRSHCYYNDSEWIKEIQTLHDKGVLPKNYKFKHFSLELNTSASTIEILARDIKIEQR